MMMAILFMGILAGLVTAALGIASARLKADEDSAVEQINRALPQIQCGQCGYAGCRPYAEALVKGSAEINQCPPGGETTIHELSRLLNREVLPPDTQYGIWKPGALAFIEEDACIGCALCLRACPVDAILGAAKYMHTVIEAECTGCELCIPACPVDCIELRQPA